MFPFFRLLVLFLIGVPFSACDPMDHWRDDVVLTVGSTRVTPDQFQRDIKRITCGMETLSSDTGGGKDLVQRAVDHYLVLEYAKDKGIHVTDAEVDVAIREAKKDYTEKDFHEVFIKAYIDYEDWKEALRLRLLMTKTLEEVSEGVSPVPLEEIRSYFEASRERFRRPEMVRFRQIVTRTLERAEEVLQRLNRGERMADLAKEFSTAYFGEKGEEGQWIARGDLDPELDDAVFSLPPGKIGAIAKTPYGFHIIEILERRPEGLMSLPEALPEIEARLFGERRQAFIRHWLGELRKIYPVEVNEEILKRLELG
ncbi:MAG: peptidyl-prolyl cis-trans isomerase [Deltaproteobacteria bacterium]|nr:peptidyl-prolyl cis-trans isomerase [Deltaproteobacteria bacterium]